MVEHTYIHNLAGLGKVHRKPVIFAAWLGAARRMVVTERDGCSTFEQSFAYDQTHIHNGGSKAALPYLHMVYYPVHVIEQQHVAALDRGITHQRIEIFKECL